MGYRNMEFKKKIFGCAYQFETEQYLIDAELIARKVAEYRHTENVVNRRVFEAELDKTTIQWEYFI